MNKPLIKTVLFCCCLLIYLGVIFLFIKDSPPLVDEAWHYPQIRLFAEGNFDLERQPTVLPGYHLFMGGLAWLFRNSSIQFIRGLNISIGLCTIIVFALLSKKIHQSVLPYRLLQFIFFPIILPYYFLVYTDILSLLIVMSGLYFGLERKYVFAGILCSISIVIRQNNVVWLIMILLITYCNQEHPRFNRQSLLKLFESCWTFGIGVLGIISYIILHGDVAFGDKQAHPAGGTYPGNLLFLLFLYGVFFLPSLIFHLYRNTLFGWKKRSSIAILLGCVFIGILVGTFHNTHPYNIIPYFLRNRLLVFFTSTAIHKIIFFISIALAIHNIAATPVKQNIFTLLYPFTVLILLPSWLIEQRYYIIPFSFYLLFSKEENQHVEKITAMYHIIISSFFIYGIGFQFFFL